ncbi:MAG TPA: AI-2E family transporter, partial [Thermoanaerobaculia bacterium]|nr:AI-2E family transporter [Thermoanaerobaculia bacterium]
MPERNWPSAGTIFKTAFIVFVAFAVGSILVYCLYRVRSVLLLVFVAAFLAIGLDPAVGWLESKKIKRGWAVTLIFLAVVLVLVGFVASVVPPLVEQATNFATNLPDYVDNLAERNQRIAEFVRDNDIAERLRQAVSDVPSQVGGSLGTIAGVAGSILGTIFNVLTVIVLTIYFSLSLRRAR